MQLNFEMPKEEILQGLLAEAKAAWGNERAEADSQAIAIAAENLWLVLQHPLDLTDEMPR